MLIALFILVSLVVAAAWALTLLAPRDAAAEGAQGEARVIAGTVVDNAADGPFYNLPTGYTQTIIVDRSNRAYIMVTHGEAIEIVPYLDEDGNQKVIPQA